MTGNSKYSQKTFNHDKQSAIDALKTASKMAIQKLAKATGNLNGNETADKITNFSRNSPQNTLETVESEIEVPEGRYISPEKNIENYRWLKIIIMEYQEIINLLDNTRKQQSEATTKNWVEINGDSHGTYSDAYTLVKEAILVANTEVAGTNASNDQ